MALPNSGQISMLDIYQEKTGLSSNRRSGDDKDFSLTGFSVNGTTVNPGASNHARDFIHDGDINEFRDGSPNESAPFAMSEFHGYSQFTWGTPGSISVNSTYPFNGSQQNRNGNDTDYCTACNMVLNTSTKTISFTFTNTDGSGGFNTNIGSTNTASISYSGTLSSLEARFVHSGQAITVQGQNGASAGKVLEVFSSTSHLSTSNINNNNTTGTGVTSFNNISSGPSGTYRSLRTTSGNMSAMLAVCTDDTSSNEFSNAEIAYTGSDSLKIQLRANGSTVVDLYTRTGSFSMEAGSFDTGS